MNDDDEDDAEWWWWWWCKILTSNDGTWHHGLGAADKRIASKIWQSAVVQAVHSIQLAIFWADTLQTCLLLVNNQALAFNRSKEAADMKPETCNPLNQEKFSAVLRTQKGPARCYNKFPCWQKAAYQFRIGPVVGLPVERLILGGTLCVKHTHGFWACLRILWCLLQNTEIADCKKNAITSRCCQCTTSMTYWSLKGSSPFWLISVTMQARTASSRSVSTRRSFVTLSSSW